MEIAVAVLWLLVGLILIVKGGDVFVDAATWIAKVSGIPTFIIGATVVSVATTLPELLTSAFAAAQGSIDMAIGNAVGSVTANIGLIMAISLLAMPLVIRRKDYAVKTALMLGAAVIICISGFFGSLSVPACVILAILFAINVWENIRAAKKGMENEADAGESATESFEKAPLLPGLIRSGIMVLVAVIACVFRFDGVISGAACAVLVLMLAEGLWEGQHEFPPAVDGKPAHDALSIAVNVSKFVLGAASIVLGARLLVDNGSALALACGVSERVISVTLIAVGTSLPELVTTLTAIIKKQTDLSVGNILGANIIDLTMILPVCAFVSGSALPISEAGMYADLPASLVVGVLACIPALIARRFRRWQGVALLVTYAVYLAVTIFVLPAVLAIA